MPSKVGGRPFHKARTPSDSAMFLMFLSMESMAFSEHQLGNLLDTVPDKVLICPKVSEGFPSRAFYCNKKMHEFFGNDPT